MDITELRRLAAKFELSLNYVAKDAMISRILFNLQNFDDIILKGGTAINRVYLNNKRFSEDIDIDLVFDGDVKEAISLTNKIVNKITHFEIVGPRIMKETIRYDLFFINPLEHKDKIMLEFRVVNKAREFDKKIVNFGFVPYNSALLQVYNIEKMIQNKIDCILNRQEGKDIFDIYYLLDQDHKKIKLSIKQKEELIDRLSFDKSEVKIMANILNHYISRKERPNWLLFIEEVKEKIRGL